MEKNKQIEKRAEEQVFLSEFGEILKPADVCAILHMGRNKVYKYLQSGRIKTLPGSQKYLIPKQYLIDFIYSGSEDEED